MWPAFFIRVRPASRNAKPACMKMTRIAVTTTQIVEAAINRSWFLGTDLDLLQACARSVVHDVGHGCRPAEAVSRLVAAARGVDDRGDDVLDVPVGDDEHQHRLRQEPGLEDTAAVLVCHAALASVTDRLDHRDADVSGRVLDRVDHRLDTLADDYRFDLVHATR